jgi:hypothetical protein
MKPTISRTPENTIPFSTISWNHVNVTKHDGEQGVAYWRTLKLPNLRLRVVEYSPGYLADHWCNKGHILYVLEGEITTELRTGETIRMSAGTSYQVSDEMSSHRSYSEHGAKLFIIDGDFLKLSPQKFTRGIWM